jgi:hypothetical protein
LKGGLTPEQATAWLKDSKGDFGETVREPWEASRFLIHPDLVRSCKVKWPDVDLD